MIKTHISTTQQDPKSSRIASSDTLGDIYIIADPQYPDRDVACPVAGYVDVRGLQVPCLAGAMMPADTLQAIAVRSAIVAYTRTHGRTPASPEDAIVWLRHQCDIG